MKKLTTSAVAKAAAVILIVICVMICLFSSIGSFYLFETDAVNNREMKYYETEAFSSNMELDARFYYYYFMSKSRDESSTNVYMETYDYPRDGLSSVNSNLNFQIYRPDTTSSSAIAPDTASSQKSDSDISDSSAADTGDTNSKIMEVVSTEQIDFTEEGSKTFDTEEFGKCVGTNYEYNGEFTIKTAYRLENGDTIVAGLIAPMQYMDNYYLLKKIHSLTHPFGSTLLLCIIFFFILGLALFIFLLYSAGRKKSSAGAGMEIKKTILDRIPLDLLLVCAITLVTLLLTLSGWIVIETIFNETIPVASTLLLVVLISAILAVIIFVLTCMSISVRIKLGKWWKNTLVWKICAWAFGLIMKAAGKTLAPLWRAIKESVKHLALQWKLTALVTFVLIVNLVAGCNLLSGRGFIVFLGFIFDIAVILTVLAIGMMMNRLKEGGKKLSDGDFESKIDMEKMIGDFREHAENLNNIGSGLQKAVDERMRSERMKTELITNVSHDIKTPLTSIVNYADLLMREPLEGPPAEYAAVIAKQAKRLKKMTEDLVEASKASTGNINVELKKTDVCEILNQSIGEYSEKMTAADLEIIEEVPSEPVYIMADGRILWRIMDNLLSNVCKYSLPKTRVYAEILSDNGKAVISIKNISKQRLNIDAEELMERFVRGDSSRSGEGSGLGLNIARSLAEIQNAGFNLKIDGDMFKAEVVFEKLQ